MRPLTCTLTRFGAARQRAIVPPRALAGKTGASLVDLAKFLILKVGYTVPSGLVLTKQRGPLRPSPSLTILFSRTRWTMECRTEMGLPRLTSPSRTYHVQIISNSGLMNLPNRSETRDHSWVSITQPIHPPNIEFTFLTNDIVRPQPQRARPRKT
jgi:hypothetical protein